jgi:hypothetical protein
MKAGFFDWLLLADDRIFPPGEDWFDDSENRRSAGQAIGILQEESH